uniref:Uncharacterized protein n=1 Tax=Arundo donax TaxID=35708 RepID=A0A0A9FWE7_ARUDO
MKKKTPNLTGVQEPNPLDLKTKARN